MSDDQDRLDRVLAFLKAYSEAADTSDIEVRIGEAVTGDEKTAAVAIDVAGERHSFTADEAVRLASVAEKALSEGFGTCAVAGLPNLILALRYGADKARSTLRKTTP